MPTAADPSLIAVVDDDGLFRDTISANLREAGYRGWVINRDGALPVPEDHSTHGCVECIYIHRENEALIGKLRLPSA